MVEIIVSVVIALFAAFAGMLSTKVAVEEYKLGTLELDWIGVLMFIIGMFMLSWTLFLGMPILAIAWTFLTAGEAAKIIFYFMQQT